MGLNRRNIIKDILYWTVEDAIAEHDMSVSPMKKAFFEGLAREFGVRNYAYEATPSDPISTPELELLTIQLAKMGDKELTNYWYGTVGEWLSYRGDIPFEAEDGKGGTGVDEQFRRLQEGKERYGYIVYEDPLSEAKLQHVFDYIESGALGKAQKAFQLSNR